MTYYILLEGDSKNAIWDENILGEESFGTFYTGAGFKALNTMVMGSLKMKLLRKKSNQKENQKNKRKNGRN